MPIITYVRLICKRLFDFILSFFRKCGFCLAKVWYPCYNDRESGSAALNIAL